MTSVQTEVRQGVNVGIAVKVPCSCATTANITLEGLQTIDGVVTTESMRVLVHLQTDAIENGIYEASSSEWQRSPDFDGYFDLKCGTMVWVTGGTNFARRQFYVTSADNSATQGPLPDTDDINFAEVSSGIPLVPQGSNTSVFLPARGKAIQLTANITVDAGIFSADDTVTLQNTTSGNLSILQGTGFTLRFAGTNTTGSRTIAAHGELTLHFVSTSEAYLFGVGIS